MRVIFAEHVADDRRALLVRTSRDETEIVHRVQHATMHGFEAVAHVGKCTRDDDAHRVIDERLPDLLVDRARKNAFAIVRSGHERVLSVGGEGRTSSSQNAEYNTRFGGRNWNRLRDSKFTRKQGE